MMKLFNVMMFYIALMLDIAMITIPIVNIINRIIAGILNHMGSLNGMYHMLYEVHQQQRTYNCHDNRKSHCELWHTKSHVIFMDGF